MSLPPTNTPLTYNCGIVGQFEYTFIPDRMDSSSNTLIVSNDVLRAVKILHAELENPLPVDMKVCINDQSIISNGAIYTMNDICLQALPLWFVSVSFHEQQYFVRFY